MVFLHISTIHSKFNSRHRRCNPPDAYRAFPKNGESRFGDVAVGERGVSRDDSVPLNIGATVKNLLKRLMQEEAGQDIIEYALLGAGISIVAILAIDAIGPKVNTIYTNISAALS